MLIFLFVLALLAAAILYGIFFLLFKLIWVLCSKQRNFWPLILAGAATLLTIIAMVWAVYSTVNKYLLPLTPIVETIQTQQQPVYGPHAYKDQRFGFGLTLYDGTVLSDWIDLPDGGPSLLVGVDTNFFLNTAPQEEKPFSAYLLARVQLPNNPSDAMEIAHTVIRQAQQAQFNGQISIEEPEEIYAGTNASAAIMDGVLSSSSGAEMSFKLLLAKNNNVLYALLGFYGQHNGQQTDQTLRSFRFNAQSWQPSPAFPAEAMGSPAF